MKTGVPCEDTENKGHHKFKHRRVLMTKPQGGFSSRGHQKTENRQMENQTILSTMPVPPSKTLLEEKKEEKKKKKHAGTEFKPPKD